MRLIELSIQPIKETGWGSRLLTFAGDVTQLYGPNGCGKTPVIHSIAYALGYPVRYRDDIVKHCDSVTLKVVHADNEITIIRKIDKTKFHISCHLSNEDYPRNFYNERDMSKFIFEFLEMPELALTSISNEPVYSYISTFLPLFYVDQDSGYTSDYKAPANFIKDQYAEMLRMSLGISPKHSYEDKKNLFERKADLDAINMEIVRTGRFLDKLVEQAGTSLQGGAEIGRKIELLSGELDQLRSSHDATSSIDSVISSQINEKFTERRAVNSNIRDLENRILDFNKIKEEIETEINTLSLNEESRRLFSSFNDICANPGCLLFLNSSESYGKNLLYLRDQMKDLDRNSAYQEKRLVEFQEQSNSLENHIYALRRSMDQAKDSETSGNLVNTISELTRSIIDLQRDKEIAIQVDEERASLIELTNRRELLQNDVASLTSGSNSIDLRVTEFRAQYRAKLVEWLDILSTRNVSRNITIDSDFNVLFGSEGLSQFSGSTLLRTVLALKAAFFEIYLSKGNSPIEFMIFDTPRQQDIEAEHFAAFVSKLKSLVSGGSAQIVFSTTVYHYENQNDDVEWTPPF